VLNSVVDEKTGGENKEVKLSQMKGGSDLTISLGKRKSKDSGIVDAEVAAKLKKSLDLSKRDTKKMLNILRKGNIKVESNVNEILEEIGRELEEEYEDVKMVFEKTEKEESEQKSKKKKKKKVIVKTETSVTVARDAAGLVKKVAEARGISLDNIKSRVVIDGGQGSLKVVVSIFDKNVDPEVTFGGQEGVREKVTGSSRLIILAEVDGGQERYSNLRQLFDKLQLEEIPGVVLVGDLCVTNVYLGISKHGGKYACYVCEGPCTLESGELRTFGSLKKDMKSTNLQDPILRKCSCIRM
jgi:hypothetical protein